MPITVPMVIQFAILAATTAYSITRAQSAKKKQRAAAAAASKAAEAAAAAARGFKLNLRTTDAPLRVLYGRHRVGSNEVYFALSGTNNEVLWIVDTYSEGPCDSIHQVGAVDQLFLDGKIYTEYGTDAVYYFHTGAADQVVDANLAAAVPEWTDPMHYTCYGVWKLTFNENRFMGLPTRHVVLNGRTLYDPRTTLTAWSANPVLIEYDFRTNARYGLGESSASLDATTYNGAATYCDNKGWVANVFHDYTKTAQDFLDELDLHMRGETTLYGNVWYKRYFDLNFEATCPAITDEQTCQDEDGKALISVTAQSRFDMPDGLSVRVINPDKEYSEDYIPIGETAGQIESLNLYGATLQQAADLGVYYLERAQLNRTITGTFRDDCVQYECGDVLELTSSALAISGQLVRVVEKKIRPDGLVELGFMYEADALYDDDYNLTAENVYTCTVPDPKLEPPSVRNVVVTEETYDYRLRTFTRLKVEFDEPLNYPWFDHVEVRISFDDIAWEHLFDTTGDFEIANIEEGVLYYIRLKVVSIYGAKQADANDYKTSKLIVGYADAPESLAALYSIVNSNTINLYASKVDDPDVELYEFRLGTAWTSAIFLAALRSPNLSLYGVKPGSHTFIANTLSNNGQYGATPRSGTADLIDPPDGWTVTDMDSVDTLVANGSMEADSNWNDYGSPTVNARSDVQAHEDTYSRKFTSDEAGDGIKSDTFTLASGLDYGWSAWVYPASAQTRITVIIRKGDDSGDEVDIEKGSLTAGAWNFIYGTFTATASGAGASIAFVDSDGDTGDWYIDDACLMVGTYTNCICVLYSGDAHIKGLHSGSLIGTYASQIYDRTASERYLVYVLAEVVFVGAGTAWEDILDAAATWDSSIAAGAPWWQIFALDEAPVVKMTLIHGAGTPPATETEKLEILSCIVTARYYQLSIEITDPNAGMYAMVKGFDLKFCQP